MHIFPFEKVEKEEHILIYGGGIIGREYAEQVRKTGYCVVEAIIDKNADNVRMADYKIIYPEDVGVYNFDKIVIALESEKNINDVKRLLLGYGVEESKILYNLDSNISDMQNVPFLVNGIEDEIIHIAIRQRFGLGDAVMDIVLINAMKRLLGNKCCIDYICKYTELYSNNPLLDNVLEDNEENNKQSYDLFIDSKHAAQIIYWDGSKIKSISDRMYDFCMNNIEIQKKYLGRPVKMHELYLKAKLMKRVRIEECDLFNNLGVSRYDRPVLTWNASEKDVLEKFSLTGEAYIVINRDVDSDGTLLHPKLWPKDYYEILLKMIKDSFPKIKLIQMGAGRAGLELENTDINLLGKTTLDETKIILKNGIILISSEGGLVHLMHFLNGRSAVIFGPTDEEQFGYEEDIKFVNRECGLPCVYMESNWMEKCMLGYEDKRCMKLVSPQMVYEGIKGLLSPLAE